MSLPQTPTEPSPVDAPKGSRHLRLRTAAVITAISLLVGYVLPWVAIGELTSVSGLDLTLGNSEAARDAVASPLRWSLLAVPLIGMALLVTGIRDLSGLRWITLGGSLVLLTMGMVVVLTAFVRAAGIGLWLVVSGIVVSVATASWVGSGD